MTPRATARRAVLATLAVLLLATSAVADDLSPLKARYEREKSQPYRTRSTVLTEISNLGTDAAARFLIRIAETDEDRSMRSNAVFWLGRIPRPVAAQALVRFCREGPEELRSTALNALGSRAEPMPRDILDGALASTNSGDRSTAIRSLQKTGDARFIPEVRRFLRDFPTSSTTLISVLVQARTPAAVRVLVEIYDDSRKYDRDQVPKLFAEGAADLRAVLVEILSGPVEVRILENAAALVGRAKVTEAEPAIVAALPGAAEDRRVLLLETIGALGGTTVEGRIALREALEDRSVAIRTAAVRGIRGAPDRLAIPTLIRMLAKEKGILEVEVRITLGRITGQQFGDRVDLWEQWWATYGEAFRLEDVRPPDPDAVDQAMIDLAIEKGAAALRRIRGKEPPWEYASHPAGTTALVVLALHAAGADVRRDRDLQAGAKYLLGSSVPQTTYDCGLVAMALEVTDARRHRRKIGDCAKRLVDTMQKNGMWGYPSGNGDNSNTQYAVLGLRSAARAGIRIPRKVWTAVRKHFLETRAYEGGWSYPGIERSAHASTSMTSAAVCCLLICLENEGLEIGSAEDRQLREAIDGGFTTLGKIMKLDTDTLYALYGLERAGILGRRAVFGDRPWYPPGAHRLVGEQGRDGFWTGSYDEAVETAFAILFLKKATAPITGK